MGISASRGMDSGTKQLGTFLSAVLLRHKDQLNGFTEGTSLELEDESKQKNPKSYF